ncbi:EAL domain-containing response regulator [Pseudohongiella sp.]|uniref:Response regulatory domain-containing protein n=1 Tax=marine sediment metagenome TaxID=412755 RepID=A0A0F9Y4Z1_9ZZZZ|nr:EAL domain-containing response regulator [Pseudohongiella sp.]HDZ10223.1 EAL domain-containing protein [Pseudohongiella sp.]HEA62239.1 EAL domain-containing protein [Pseudohongiella sp.]
MGANEDNANHSGRLLVLDDDINVSATICAIADRAGFETQATTKAEEFFQLVMDWQPTHLIVDLVMPEVDGVETLHRLALSGHQGSVIVTSGLGGRVLEAASRAAEENGLRVSGVLPKPFTPAKLRSLLHQEPGDQKPPTATVQYVSPVSADMLATALAQKQLCVHYQPKIECTTEKVVGFESLVRWEHPERGMIFPDQFITLAERHGHIAELTRQVFDMSLAWFAANFLETDLKLAINMSPIVLADAQFPVWIKQACERYGVAPSQITLEITETSSMENPVASLEYLTQFRIKGFNLSIDDFGVGYSSLVQLARLPFSEMKIDKMFVMSASSSIESQKIATAVIGLANALDLNVTAEGVEDDWTLQFLCDLGCTHAQGYHIGRPMAPKLALQWLHDREKRP